MEDHDALVPEKKFVDFQRLSVPAIMTSSLAGHFARRAMNGTFALSIPESAATNEVPPFADSDGSRAGIPIEAEHRFRGKPNTRSDRIRTVIPSQAEHPAG